MLKQILIAGLLISSIYAQEKSNKFKIDELVILPHPGKFIKQGKIELTMEQMEKLQVVKKTIIPGFQDKMRQAFVVEKKLRRAVEKGKDKVALTSMIDEIAKLKREALERRLDALYEIQKILTKEQWKIVNKLTYK